MTIKTIKTISSNLLVVRKTEEVKEVADGSVQLSISRTDGKKGKSGLCIVAPALSINTIQSILNQEAGQVWITEAIDGLRSKMASALNKAGSVITESNIAMTAVLAAMAVENASQRMTKESIGEWFDSDLSGLVAERIEARLPGIASDKMEKLLKGYRELFQSLAGRDVNMPEQVKEQLERAIALLPDDYSSTIGEKVSAKLATVTEASEILNVL